MPASTPVELHHGLTVEAEPIGEQREVYFTDEAPRFKLIVRNEGKQDYGDGSGFRWYLGIGTGRPDPFRIDDISFEVARGETAEFEIGGRSLAFEGHGAIGISRGNVKRINDSTMKVESGPVREAYQPVYSFSVWDRSQYESQHEYPQRLQRLAVYLTGGIVVFSVLSLLVALVNLLVTLINAGFV